MIVGFTAGFLWVDDATSGAYRSGVPISADEIRREFDAKLKTLACPHCDTTYTDFTVEWLHAYLEGRRDALNDLGTTERDGPIKLKCELCGGQALTNVFLTPPKAI